MKIDLAEFKAALLRDKEKGRISVVMGVDVLLALIEAVEASKVVADSPAGKRYGFLPLLNALAPFTEDHEQKGRAS